MTEAEKQELKAIQAEREAKLFSEHWQKGISILDEFANTKIAEERSRVLEIMERLILAASNHETRRLLIQGMAEIKGEQ